MVASNDLNISQSGIVTFDGVSTFSGRTLQAGSGIVITNGDGVSGNPNISASGAQNIAGDTGTISGTNLTIYADNVANNAGQSVKFTNSGAISTLNLTDANLNTMLGKNCGKLGQTYNTTVGIGASAGNSMTTATGCVFVGSAAGFANTSGVYNTFIGGSSGLATTTGSSNTAVGHESLASYTSGAANAGSNVALGKGALSLIRTGINNIAIGVLSGVSHTLADSSNIDIGNSGVLGESNVIRLGTAGSGTGQQNKCYVAGITGVTAVGSPAAVSSTGQLSDLGFGTSTQVLTSNGAGVSPTWQAIPMHAATAFRAYLNANTAANITGDGTLVTVQFDTVDYDTDSGYDTGTYTYTVPVGKTGIWQINYTVFAYRTAGTNTAIILNLLKNATTIRNYEMNFENTQTSGELTLTSGMQAKLTAGDTVKVQCNVAGNASKNIGFAGTYCIFSGTFLGTA